jgi:membrane protein
MRVFRDIFQGAFVEWGRDHSTLLAASLAYYGLFSLAPLMIIILISINFLFHQSEQGQMMAQQVQDLAGQQAPPVVKDIIDQFGNQAAYLDLTFSASCFFFWQQGCS